MNLGAAKKEKPFRVIDYINPRLHNITKDFGELTNFMYMFDLPEVKMIYPIFREHSPNKYVDAILQMQMDGRINISNAIIGICKKSDNQHIFTFKSEYIYIAICEYGWNCLLYIKIKPTHIIDYDMNKFLNKIETDSGFSWGDYKNKRNSKKKQIDDNSKIKFLTNIIKHKCNQ